MRLLHVHPSRDAEESTQRVCQPGHASPGHGSGPCMAVAQLAPSLEQE